MNKKEIQKILKYYRIKDWIHYLGYVLLGSVASKNFHWMNFWIASLMLAYAYSFNEYSKHKKRYFLLPLIISIPFLYFLSNFQFFDYFSFILIFTLYSWPKIWLEGKPIISTFSNGIGFSLLFLFPFKSYKETFYFFPILLLLFFLNIGAQLIHEIIHYKMDKKIRKFTTCVKFGIKNSISLLRISLLIVIFLALFISKYFKLIALSTLTFSLYFFSSSYKKVDIKFRKRFKNYGIICGIFYLIDFF